MIRVIRKRLQRFCLERAATHSREADRIVKLSVMVRKSGLEHTAQAILEGAADEAERVYFWRRWAERVGP